MVAADPDPPAVVDGVGFGLVVAVGAVVAGDAAAADVVVGVGAVDAREVVDPAGVVEVGTVDARDVVDPADEVDGATMAVVVAAAVAPDTLEPGAASSVLSQATTVRLVAATAISQRWDRWKLCMVITAPSRGDVVERSLMSSVRRRRCQRPRRARTFR